MHLRPRSEPPRTDTSLGAHCCSPCSRITSWVPLLQLALSPTRLLGREPFLLETRPCPETHRARRSERILGHHSRTLAQRRVSTRGYARAASMGSTDRSGSPPGLVRCNGTITCGDVTPHAQSFGCPGRGFRLPW